MACGRKKYPITCARHPAAWKWPPSRHLRAWRGALQCGSGRPRRRSYPGLREAALLSRAAPPPPAPPLPRPLLPRPPPSSHPFIPFRVASNPGRGGPSSVSVGDNEVVEGPFLSRIIVQIYRHKDGGEESCRGKTDEVDALFSHIGRFPIMGQLEFMEEMQRFRLFQTRNGSSASAKRKVSPCHQDDGSHGSKRMVYSGPELAEDIWCHIHSLMLLRDAARVACVSRAFFRSWRSHPHLMFDIRNIGCPGLGRGFASRVDPILQNHSGNGLKTLKLDFTDFYNAKASSCIDSWLEIAITAGIEELSLNMFSGNGEYNFPCSLLSNESGSSIEYLRLVNCAFRPTVRLGRLRSLKTLHLCEVPITGDELECLLSSCVALQRLELRKCSEVTWLKLPFLLQQLSCLKVSECYHLQMIKSEAPSISSFQFRGGKLKLLLGESLQLKNLDIDCSHGIIYYARKELPSSAPNLESLTICSTHEKLTTTMMPSKFAHLKYLRIFLRCAYDYLSLVSFLDAAPSLETFILKVWMPTERVDRQSIFVDTSPVRRMPGYRHGKLKRAKITRFYSAKSLVELACHIIENAISLECLTLDTSAGRCALNKLGCYPMSNRMDIPKAISAIRTYIDGIVPSTVELNVMKPCNRCYIC